MKFEYDDTPDEARKPVAWLYRMESCDTQEVALCIATTNNERFVWAYSDGEISVQPVGPSGGALKVFYEGDSLTITF